MTRPMDNFGDPPPQSKRGERITMAVVALLAIGTVVVAPIYVTEHPRHDAVHTVP